MENNKQTRTNGGNTVLIVLLLLITIVAVILATYAWAKYTETFDNNEATAQVAKWNVNATKGTTMFSKTFDHVIEERMAPGTDGSLTSSLDVTGTEVDVAYTVTLVSVDPVDANSVIPQNLVLKADDGTVIYKNKAIVGSGEIATGTIPAGSTGASAKVDKALKWEWPFETGTTPEEKQTNNAQDTADGKKAGSLKITYKIEAVQVEPTVGA